MKLKKPLKIFRINQKFGENATSFYKESGMKGHNGIDFYALDSTEVYASHDGRVTFAGYDGGGGLGVVIRTEDKYPFEGKDVYFKTIYWHLKKDSLKVTGGQNVRAGDLIGLADNTGRSTGSHLHFALKPIARGEQPWVWWNVKQDNGYLGAIDPLPFFEDIDPPKEYINMTLRFGMRHEQVKVLQRKLGIPDDGIFGQRTSDAVMLFQFNNNLIPDGIVGPKTREKLNI